MHRAQAFTQRSFHRQQASTQISFHIENLLRRMCQNGSKSAAKALFATFMQPCSHYNTIYDFQLQKTKVLRTQLQWRGALTQPFRCDLQTQLQNIMELRTTAAQIAAPKLDLDAKAENDDFEAPQRNFKRKIINVNVNVNVNVIINNNTNTKTPKHPNTQTPNHQTTKTPTPKHQNTNTKTPKHQNTKTPTSTTPTPPPPPATTTTTKKKSPEHQNRGPTLLDSILLYSIPFSTLVCSSLLFSTLPLTLLC